MRPSSAFQWAVLWAACLTTFVAVWLLFATPARSDTGDDLRREVVSTLLHHTLYIRHAYTATYLHFDEAGAILNGARTGYWSETGAVYPTKVEVWGSGVIHMEAERVAVAFDQKKQSWAEVRRPTAHVVIDIQFAPGHLIP